MPYDNLKVGSITANYNNGQFINECIDALINQTRSLDYITIIDDKSTDDSYNIVMNKIASLSKGFNHDAKNNHGQCIYNGIEINLFQNNKNGGPAYSRNIGIKYLIDKVNIIANADSDDVYYPTKIEESVKVMVNNPHIGLVYSDYDTENLITKEKKREFKEIFDYSRLLKECIISNNSVIATSIFKEVGLFDEDPSVISTEDYLQWMKIASSSLCYHIPKALYKYRLHNTNLTVATPQNILAQRLQACFMKFEQWMQNRNQNVKR